MSDARIAEASRAAAGPIGAIGAAFMLHPDTFKRAGESGYEHPFACYFAGRGGVLGDVDAEVINAVFWSFEPGLVDMFWSQGQPVHGAAKAAGIYSDQMAAWARDHIATVPGLDRIVELGEKVIAAAPSNGLPLYAGWKVMPRASDPAARAMQVLFVLREWRGAIHMAALTAAGLKPVEAHFLNKGPQEGPQYASMFGWDEPWPSVDHLKAKGTEVEVITNQRCAEVWAKALTADEAEELANLVAAVEKAISS